MDLPSVTIMISVSLEESSVVQVQLTRIQNLFVEEGDMVEATKIKSESVSKEGFVIESKQICQHTCVHIQCNDLAYLQTTGAVHKGIACKSNRQRA
jgi:hypothetical protein